MSTIDWLKELAQAELHMEETGEIDAFGHLDEEKILLDHTTSFLKELRHHFQLFANDFNEHRKNTRQTIKVYGISNTQADFLLFRNSLKLVVTLSKPGQVEFSFHAMSGGLFAPNKKPSKKRKLGIPKPPDEMKTDEGDFLEIELGPFNEAY